MIIRRSDERGYADHGWLQARHTFSFAGYHDPEHMGFGPLRVLNQDRVAAGEGFPPHPHRDMEIVTWILEGELEHKDSMGNTSVIRPGEIQLMSAGTGVQHSEYNASDEEDLELLQMWVFPEERGGEPRYEQIAVAALEDGTFHQVVSPEGGGSAVRIGRDARMFAARPRAGTSLRHELDSTVSAWLHLARGRAVVNGEELRAGDGASFSNEPVIEVDVSEDADIILWQFPTRRQ